MAYDSTKSRWRDAIHHYGERSIFEGRRILVYGEMGTGKSSLCASFPKVLFIDADFGENEISADRGWPVLYIDKKEPFKRILNILADCLAKRDIFDPDGGPNADTQTIAIDSWTKVNEMLLVEICVEDGIDLDDERVGIGQYGTLKSRQQTIMRLAKELNLTRGINILATALPLMEGSDDEKLTRDPAKAIAKSGYEKIAGGPNMIGGYRKIIGAEFEEVYYMEIVQSGATLTRRLWTVPHANYSAKSRLGLPPSIDAADYTKITALAKAKRDARATSTVAVKPVAVPVVPAKV